MGSTRRFTILEHRWNGVHWDFLVENGPTLRTWAIDRPIVAGVDLPARSQPDHRRVYLDFEGEISGGRGSVTRWDGGFCEVTVWEDDRVVLALRGAQLVGLAELRRTGTVEDDPRPWLFRLGKLS